MNDGGLTPGLSRRLLFAYGVPGLPLAALGLPLYVYLPSFYVETVALGLAAVGWVLLLARAWDVITDPLVGACADHVKLPLGRRKGMIVLGAPLMMVAVYALFVPPDAASDIYLLPWSIVAYLGWTMVFLSYSAWGAELSAEYHQRSRVTASREGFVILGTLVALTLPAALGHDAASRDAMMWLAVFVIAGLPIALTVVVRAVPEPRRHDSFPSWRDGLGLVLKNRPFVRLFSAYLLNGTANAFPASLFILYVSPVLDSREAVGPLLALCFLSGVAALPVWLRLAKRYVKHRVWAASMVLACAAFVWVPLLGPGDMSAFVLICVLSGLSLGVDMALPASIQADVIDYDRALGGGARAALFFGLWGMGTKLALAIAVGATFPVLDWVGFNTGGNNTASALLTLALLYALLPTLIKLTAVGLVWRFPLNRNWQRRLVEAKLQHV